MQRAPYILGGKQRQNNGARDESLCQCPREHQARPHSALGKPAQDREGLQTCSCNAEASEVSPERACPMKMEFGFKE